MQLHHLQYQVDLELRPNADLFNSYSTRSTPGLKANMGGSSLVTIVKTISFFY